MHSSAGCAHTSVKEKSIPVHVCFVIARFAQRLITINVRGVHGTRVAQDYMHCAWAWTCERTTQGVSGEQERNRRPPPPPPCVKNVFDRPPPFLPDKRKRFCLHQFFLFHKKSPVKKNVSLGVEDFWSLAFGTNVVFRAADWQLGHRKKTVCGC